jgi:hypothetical protein
MKGLKHDFDHMYFMTTPHKIGDIMPHAALSEMEKSDQDLLESEAKASASIQAMMRPRYYHNHSQRVPRQMIGVHLAAYFGMREAIISLIQERT